METNLITQYINSHPQVNSNRSPIKFEHNSGTATENLPNDSVSFLEMSIKLKTEKDDSTQGILIDKGKINGEDAIIKTSCSNIQKCIYKEGIINNKELSLVIDANNSKQGIYHYQGFYNNKEIDLTIEIPKEENKFKKFFKQTICNNLYIPDEININGTIDGKDYSLTLPHAKVPRDPDEKDLLTLMLYTHRYDPGTFQGEIVSINPAKARIEYWNHSSEKREEFFKENVKPLISQTLSSLCSVVVGILIAKIGLKK